MPVSIGPTKDVLSRQPNTKAKMQRLSGRLQLRLVVWVVGLLALAILLLRQPWQLDAHQVSSDKWKSVGELDARRAYGYLKQICALGPRPSGSPAMLEMQRLVTEHCEKFGAQVLRQTFQARHPEDGSAVNMTNLIVRWAPEKENRILLCAHYDTRPFPDEDPVNPRGTFIGANDGGSGVALLMEICHSMRGMPLNVGVDFVLFDGEEFIFQKKRDDHMFFFGSAYFAQQIASGAIPTRYRHGILVDMIADKTLDLYYERNSFRYAEELTVNLWKIAQKLQIREFRPRLRHEIRDDHEKLNEIAKIPTTDLIDFDYPSPNSRGVKYWHTTQDVVENCSGESICKVAAVLLEWIKLQK